MPAAIEKELKECTRICSVSRSLSRRDETGGMVSWRRIRRKSMHAGLKEWVLVLQISEKYVREDRAVFAEKKQLR